MRANAVAEMKGRPARLMSAGQLSFGKPLGIVDARWQRSLAGALLAAAFPLLAGQVGPSGAPALGLGTAHLTSPGSIGPRTAAATAPSASTKSSKKTKKPPAPRPKATGHPRPPLPEAAGLVHDPIVRVGLTAARERVVITCKGSFRVTDPNTGRNVWKESYNQPLIVGIRGPQPTEGRIYRAQLGSFQDKGAAQEVAARMGAQLGEPSTVAWSADRKVWRVRVGEADSREGLGDVIERLRAAGYEDAWVTDEAREQAAPGALVLVDANYNTKVPGLPILAIAPAADTGILAVDGRPYRGSFEVRLDRSGAIRVVNLVPMETYLRGVVPSELGPNVYPEIEALKAQAIAARTYAYRNLGQFADDGFDMCDTPRCQVYDGQKAEHELSDRAVLETDGEIATYEGRPINALYASTCGGHTEDAVEIFPEDAAPYLQGVACAPEQGTRSRSRMILTGNWSLADASGASAEAAALLAVHRLLLADPPEASTLRSPVTEQEAERAIGMVRSACGIAEQAKKHEPGSGQMTMAELGELLIARLGWSDRVDLLVKTEQPESWLLATDLQGGEAPLSQGANAPLSQGANAPLSQGANAPLNEAQAAAVAYLVREKAWPLGPGGLPDPTRPATLGDLAQMLVYAARECELVELDEAIVRSAQDRELRLTKKAERLALDVAPEAYLFADFGAGPSPVRRLVVVPGDKVRYHVGAAGTIDELLLMPGRQGVSDDRYSNLSAWRVTYTPEDLASKLRAYLGTGTLVDLVAVKRGVSGRVTELRIVGSGGSSVLKGFGIRSALGVKDTLFTIQTLRARSGALRRVVISGRGWGHGIGLCQVGAYGMALRGATYREILTHYYTGISLSRIP